MKVRSKPSLVRWAGLWLGAVLLAGCGGGAPAAAPHGAGPEAAGAAAAGPLFTDEASRSGLDFVHFNGMSGEYYFAEMTGPGGALFDYDNDGDLDVFLVQGTMLGPGKTIADALFPPRYPLPLEDRLYRNDLVVHPDGTRTLHFTDVTAESGIHSLGYGMGVIAADFNNDGWVDLYVTNFGPNQMFYNNGDGTFRDVTAEAGTDDPRWSVPAAAVDYDRDGWLDLFVGNYVDYTVATNKACRSAAGAMDYCGPHSYRPVPDRLFHNRGDGTFEDVSSRSGLDGAFGAALGVVPGDFDGDGWMDIYVANDGSANQLWVNQKDGTFRNDALLAGAAVNADGQPEAGMGVDAGDFDNDGDEDIFIAHLSLETSTLYRNLGQGMFEDATVSTDLGAPSWEYTGFGAGWLDYDNDGWLDLLVVNGAVKVIEALARAHDPYPLHQRNQLFHNLGDSRFEEVTAQAGPAFQASEVSRGAAFGDIDNDGDMDVLIVNNNGPARLLVNQVGAKRPWIGLRLVGSDGLRDMLGAWVGVFQKGGPTQWRRVRGGGSYGSSGDPRVLVGLKSPAVEKVLVRWPDGRREEFHPDGVNRYWTFREGTGGR